MRLKRKKFASNPVLKSELEEGNVYFFVNFIDEEMLVPAMEPFVFVGKNLEEGDVGRVYFQDIDSHQNGVRYTTTTELAPATFYTGSEDELGHVFDYEHALEVLKACSLRRQRAH
jgi:hypothetical protein